MTDVKLTRYVAMTAIVIVLIGVALPECTKPNVDGSPSHCKQLCEPRLVDKFEFNGSHVVCKCAEKGIQP